MDTLRGCIRTLAELRDEEPAREGGHSPPDPAKDEKGQPITAAQLKLAKAGFAKVKRISLPHDANISQ